MAHTNADQAKHHLTAWAEEDRRLLRTEADHHPKVSQWKTEATIFEEAVRSIEQEKYTEALGMIEASRISPPGDFDEDETNNYRANMQWVIDLLSLPEGEFQGFNR